MKHFVQMSTQYATNKLGCICGLQKLLTLYPGDWATLNQTQLAYKLVKIVST